MKSVQTYDFGQKVILSQQTFCLVSIKGLKDILIQILVVESFFYIVLLEQGVVDKIAIRKVVQNRVAKDLKLLVAGI